MKNKFNIGQLAYYVESSTNYGKMVPCEMCFGKCFVTIILGDDSKEKIECGACGHGVHSPSGQMKIWEPSSVTHSGLIAGIEKDDEAWSYKIGYRNLKEHELFNSKEEAEPKRLKEFERCEKTAETWYEDSFISTKKKQIWSASYHRDSIKRSKRSIGWHEMRLMKIKEKKNEIQ